MIAVILGGVVTGLALGLTGGGGTLLALPIFQRLVGLELAQAVTASLGAVAVLSLVGALGRLREGATRPSLGVLFAAAGAAGAPAGALLHRHLPEALLLGAFAAVVLVVAARTWLGRGLPLRAAGAPGGGTGAVCGFTADGRLQLTARCGLRLALLGLGVGLLSGLVGVGGGFLAVPALMALTGLPLRSVVATSLLVVGLIAGTGWVSHQALGHGAPAAAVLGFAAAGLAGLAAGTALVRRIPPVAMRRAFAALLAAVALANLVPVFFA